MPLGINNNPLYGEMSAGERAEMAEIMRGERNSGGQHCMLSVGERMFCVIFRGKKKKLSNNPYLE